MAELFNTRHRLQPIALTKKTKKIITKVDKWRENAILISFERGGKKKD